MPRGQSRLASKQAVPVLMPYFFATPVGRYDDAVPVSAAADPHRTAFKFGIQSDFATGEKAVAIHVQDSIGMLRTHDKSVSKASLKMHGCQ